MFEQEICFLRFSSGNSEQRLPYPSRSMVGIQNLRTAEHLIRKVYIVVEEVQQPQVCPCFHVLQESQKRTTCTRCQAYLVVDLQR